MVLLFVGLTLLSLSPLILGELIHQLRSRFYLPPRDNDLPTDEETRDTIRSPPLHTDQQTTLQPPPPLYPPWLGQDSLIDARRLHSPSQQAPRTGIRFHQSCEVCGAGPNE